MAGSLQRLLFGENPDSSEGGGFQLPPGLPISPEVDYQIASSFYRGQLQAARTGRQQAAVARATPQKPPPVYAQPRPRELPERSGEKSAGPQLTPEQEQMVEPVTDPNQRDRAGACRSSVRAADAACATGARV